MNIIQKLIAGCPKMPRLFLAFAPLNMPVAIAVSLVQWLLRKLSPLTYNGKFELYHLLRSHFRYFDAAFSEMFNLLSSPLQNL